MDKTFEENYKKIEELLVDLEDNKENLDESIKIYEEATALYKELKNQLDDYRAKVEVIGKDE